MKMKAEFNGKEQTKNSQHSRGKRIASLILSLLFAKVYDQLKRCNVSTKQLSEFQHWQMARNTYIMDILLIYVIYTYVCTFFSQSLLIYVLN